MQVSKVGSDVLTIVVFNHKVSRHNLEFLKVGEVGGGIGTKVASDPKVLRVGVSTKLRIRDGGGPRRGAAAIILPPNQQSAYPIHPCKAAKVGDIVSGQNEVSRPLAAVVIKR